MSAFNELTKPETDDDFEAMCHALYRELWNDVGCSRVGRKGQPQFGVDILGHRNNKPIGIQCKRYSRTTLTLATIKEDIEKADKASLPIEHLIFATTSPSNAHLVRDVFEISSRRRLDGKFTVSVDSWDEISGHLRLHPDVGRAFIRDFPGAPILALRDDVGLLQATIDEGQRQQREMLSEVLSRLPPQSDTPVASDLSEGGSAARGDEADPAVARILDLVRDRIREGRTQDARELLTANGPASSLRDKFSQFRWHTNYGCVLLIDGDHQAGAKEFLTAYEILPDDEKANSNRAYAHLILGDYRAAIAAAENGIAKYPHSPALWAMYLHASEKSGDSSAESRIPAEIFNHTDLLFARAQIMQGRDRHHECIELVLRFLAASHGSIEGKRLYLAATLSWLLKDPTLAHHGQFSREQRQWINDAIARFEPLERTIATTQSDHVSLEISSNLAVALVLVGDQERAREVAKSALSRHPLSEELLKIAILGMDARDDVEGIVALTDALLAQLPASVLLTLAEISANRGMLDWHERVLAAVRVAGPSPTVLLDIEALAIHARWVSGDRIQAIEQGRAQVQSHPTHVLTRVVLGQMLKRSGDDVAAQEQAAAAENALGTNSPTFATLHVAGLWFDLENYERASRLYEQLVLHPGNDELTRRLLVSLIESDQRRKAGQVFERLDPAIRDLSKFRRLEVALARQMGDWRRIKILLDAELRDHPNESGLAVVYAASLFRLDATTELRDFLSTDPVFEDAPAENEFEFAKYQSASGFPELATKRLYRLYRNHSANALAASYFLGQVLVNQSDYRFPTFSRVVPGTVVQLMAGGQPRTVAIDVEGELPAQGGWPELVGSKSETAANLLGRELGDQVRLPSVFGDHEFEVVGIESVYTFALQKAQNQISTSAAPSGPVWSANLLGQDGSLQTGPLARSAKTRRTHVNAAFDQYRRRRFPLAILASMIGTDVVSLMLDWPYREATLFVGVGTAEERDAAFTIIKQPETQYVLDAVTVAELVVRGTGEVCAHTLGRMLVPQTVREHLQKLMLEARSDRSTGMLLEDNGKLILHPTPREHYEQRCKLLEQMLAFVDTRCESVPTVGPELVTEAHRALSRMLDGATLDAVYLALERDAVLVTEDGALRSLLPEIGIRRAIGTQPVLQLARARNFMKQDAYTDAIIAKISASHDFVSLSAADLVVLAKRTPAVVSDLVRRCIESFRKNTLDLMSGANVCGEFVAQIVPHLPTPISAGYCRIALSALQHGRDDFTWLVREALIRAIDPAISSLPAGTEKKARKDFAFLLEDRAPYVVLRITSIARAIRDMFSSTDPG